MSEKQWTVGKELCDLTASVNVKEALVALGMLKPSALDFQIRGQQDWEIGGAETYIFRFWVKEPECAEVGYIIKVCIAFAPGIGVEGTLKRWIERRELLASCGVSVPKLFYVGKGQIIEELIQWHIQDRLNLSNEQTQHMLNSLAEFAGYLAQKGFFPIGGFNDLRSRGTDVVAVDFGSDLGPPKATTEGSPRPFEEMLTTLHRWRINLDLLTITRMQERFNLILKQAL